MSTLKEAAISYARDFGFAVHPLVPRGKRPATENGFLDATRDVDQIAAAWDAMPDLNIGLSMGAPSGNVICIDVDRDDDAGYDGMDFVKEWEAEHGELPETVSAVTGRGGCHMFYRVDHEVRPSVNEHLRIDVRGDGSYVMAAPSVHPNGRRVEWEFHPEEYPVADADDNVLAFIDAVRPSGFSDRRRRFELPEKIAEGGRNNMLHKYACSLQSKGRSDDEIVDAVIGANAARCEPPLPTDEVRRIVESALGYDKGEERKADDRGEGKPRRDGFDHAEFADRLIEERHMRYIDGAPAVWNGRSYEVGKRAIESAMISMRRGVKDRERREVLKYLDIRAPRVEMADKRFIAFDNCVLDVETMETRRISPDMHITNVIPHKWNPDATCDEVDATVGRIACGDLDVFSNLFETIGMCMYRGTEFATCPILLGRGSNGKSTFLNMIHRVLGDENVASMDVATVGERFQSVALMGKLANIGDDISNEFISGSKASVFKKVVSGDYVQAEYKGGDTFMFKPYCTMVFSCNEMPRIGDGSYGMMRRLHPIPLNANFSKLDEDYDPNIERKLATEEAVERAIVLGVEGLRSCLERHGMTDNEKSRAEAELIRMDNSSVYSWAIDSYGVGGDTWTKVDGRPICDEYERYKDFCDEAGFMPVNRNSFTKQVNSIYGTESAPTRVSYASGSRLVRVFRKSRYILAG